MTLFYCLWELFCSLLSGTSLAILISAFSAWLISRQAIRKNRETVSDKETVLILHKTIWDNDFIKTRDAFIKARNEGISTYIGKKDTDGFRAIIKMMNHYELLALGVKKKILSNSVLEKFMRSQLINDWQESKDFVEDLRETSEKPKIFCEFQSLAEDWQEQKDEA